MKRQRGENESVSGTKDKSNGNSPEIRRCRQVDPPTRSQPNDFGDKTNISTTTTTTSDHHPVRHVEKRRMGTCPFGDRVAKAVLDVYRNPSIIPTNFSRDEAPQTCVAGIVAHYDDAAAAAAVVVVAEDVCASIRKKDDDDDDDDDDANNSNNLRVIAMGVGTKFLSEQTLQQEVDDAAEAEQDDERATVDRKDAKDRMELEKHAGTTKQHTHQIQDESASRHYGARVRDCHAEVLARRGFRRYLTNEILQHQAKQRLSLQQDCLEKNDDDETSEEFPSRFNLLEPIVAASRSDEGVTDVDAATPHEEGTDSPFTDPRLPRQHCRYYYRLRDGITLHFYSSSAPCGNATLKKFATMRKERSNSLSQMLGPDEWPKTIIAMTNDTSTHQQPQLVGRGKQQVHEPVALHSKHLGQIELLVKRDHNRATTEVMRSETTAPSSLPPASMRSWPSLQNDDWCPPGTATVWHNRGSIHTCSDKLCRWNLLGLQGSLLSTILHDASKDDNNKGYGRIHMTSLTVGRKFTSVICQRAVCCRAAAVMNNAVKKKKNKKKGQPPTVAPQLQHGMIAQDVNHPSLMETSVYMDEMGVLDMSSSLQNDNDDGKNCVNQQDCRRFISNKSWVWWANNGNNKNSVAESEGVLSAVPEAECIDGSTGFVIPQDNGTNDNSRSTTCQRGANSARGQVQVSSSVSTQSLMRDFCLIVSQNEDNNNNDELPRTLARLRAMKRKMSQKYEASKDLLLSRDALFRNWKRREYRRASLSCHEAKYTNARTKEDMRST